MASQANMNGSYLSIGSSNAHQNIVSEMMGRVHLNLPTVLVDLSHALRRIHEQQDALQLWHEKYKYLQDDYQDLHDRYQKAVDINMEYITDLRNKDVQLKNLEVEMATRRLEHDAEMSANTGQANDLSSPESLADYCDLFEV